MVTDYRDRPGHAAEDAAEGLTLPPTDVGREGGGSAPCCRLLPPHGYHVIVSSEDAMFVPGITFVPGTNCFAPRTN